MIKQHKELRKQFKTYDEHDMHAWSENKPWWLRPLQVLGFVAAGIGLAVCIYYSTLIVLSL